MSPNQNLGVTHQAASHLHGQAVESREPHFVQWQPYPKAANKPVFVALRLIACSPQQIIQAPKIPAEKMLIDIRSKCGYRMAFARKDYNQPSLVGQ